MEMTLPVASSPTTRAPGPPWRRASGHTITAYRDAIRLLVVYAAGHASKTPSTLDLADLDASLIGAYLNHLESGRHHGFRTRNARPAAIHSLFRHAAPHRPDDAAVIQRVLAIPPKRFDRTLVSYLTEDEITALLAAPDRGTWTGRRDAEEQAVRAISGSVWIEDLVAAATHTTGVR
jgi:integrase/recombinase XerD